MNIKIAQMNIKIVIINKKKDVFKINSNEFMSLNEKQFIGTKQFVDYFFVHLNYFYVQI